jgi:hypothetical protein
MVVINEHYFGLISLLSIINIIFDKGQAMNKVLSISRSIRRSMTKVNAV